MTSAPDPMLAHGIGKDTDQAGMQARYDRIINGDGWALEQKVDGHRRLVTVDGTATGWTRRGLRAGLPRPVTAALAGLNGTVLDGEFVDDHLHLFDLLCVGGTDIRDQPYRMRRDLLERLLESLDPDPAAVTVIPAAWGTDDKTRLVETLSSSNREGVIAKRADSRYQSRRSWDWVKVKFTKDIDCVVTGLRIDDRDNIGLGVYPGPGKPPMHVGEVTRLAGDGTRIAERYLAEQAKQRPRPVVVTVRVLCTTADGRLREPTYPVLRTDKKPSECLAGQLAEHLANKDVMEVLP